LISERLLLSDLILIQWVLSELCDDRCIDRVEQVLLLPQLSLDVVLLIVGLTGFLHDDVAINAVVEHDLLYRAVKLEAPLTERKSGGVAGRLRIVSGQLLEMHGVLLLLGEIFLLVSATHGLVLDIEHLIVFLHVL